MAAFSQSRFAELQEWFYKAERSGVLSHDVSALAAKVGGIKPPSDAELAAFKQVLSTVTGAKPGASGVDKETYSGAAKLQAALKTYQATRPSPLPITGKMTPETWSVLGDTGLGEKAKQAFAAANESVRPIQQKTIKDFSTSHGLWMKAREAAGKPVQGLAREPMLSILSAGIESQFGHPAYSDNGRYFGAVQLNDKVKSWFAEPAMQKTVIERLNQMAKLAGPNADKDLKGEWNEARLHAQYKTNNYIQSVAYNEYMSKNTVMPEGKTIYEKVANLYLGHLLPVGKQIIDANINSNEGLFALAVKLGKNAKEWAPYMLDNKGAFMRQVLDAVSQGKSPNEWMKNLGEFTARQVSSAISGGTLAIDANKLVTDTPKQIRENAAHYLKTIHEGVNNPRPATNANVAVSTTKLPQPAGSAANAPEEKAWWRQKLNSVGFFGKW